MNLKVYNVVNNLYDIEEDGTVQYNIVYSEKSERNKLDLYLPKHNKENYPVVVFIHGGAFFKSDKTRHLSNILNCLLYGYAVASINFRLNDEATYPMIRQDCIEALNYLSSMDIINSNKIIVWGESHGAFLANDITINCKAALDFSMAGVVSFYAPIDLYDYFYHKEVNQQHVIINGKENDSVTFGVEGEALMNELKKYSILDKIEGNEPPIFLLHGIKDDNIPFKYSVEFDKVLTLKKVPHILNLVDDGLHGIDYYSDPKNNEPVIKFIDHVFNGC